jgi:competence protein ComEC
MEIFFLDVGQGTCQVIMLGQRRAIVIDCGLRNDKLVLQFLQRSGVEYLERLIVSHSHDDHNGGAVSIMGAYQDRVGKYCFVQDHLFLRSAFWTRLKDLYANDRITRDQMVRLEVEEKPQVVWKDESKSIRLQTFSPSAVENLMAQDGEKPNATSAVLFLQSGANRVIFAADSEVPQWKEIHRASGKKLECDVLAVPHHAGKMHSSRRDLKWLYEDVLSATTAVVSAGTSNTHGHPRSDVIEAMTASGMHVLCTQITRRCNGNVRDLEHLRPGVLRPQTHLGRSSAAKDLTDSGHSKNVACAGTVRVEITATDVIVERLADHQRAVDRLPRNATACPLCRVAASSN